MGLWEGQNVEISASPTYINDFLLFALPPLSLHTQPLFFNSGLGIGGLPGTGHAAQTSPGCAHTPLWRHKGISEGGICLGRDWKMEDGDGT